MMFLIAGCEQSDVLKLILFIKELLNIVYFIIPIALIIMLSVDMAKNVIANKEDDMKKNLNTFMKRILYCVALFLVKPIVVFAISLLGNTNLDFVACIELANKETITEVQKLEDEAEEIEKIQKELEEYEKKKQEETVVNPTTGETTVVDNKVTKVLLIGNSGTYVNGYGEMLAKMGKKTNKKIVVVMATKGGNAGKGKNLITNNLDYVCWSANTNSCSNQSGSKKLSSILEIDFASLNRKNSWDYIVLQNHKTSSSEIYDSDIAIYNVIKKSIINKKNFIIHVNNYGISVSSGRIKYHLKAAKKIASSLVDTAEIFGKYSNWQKVLLIGDNPNYHQSGQGAYMYATIIYSKIYGTSNLAKSSSDSNFIELYNADGKTTKTLSSYQYKSGNTKYGAMSVTKSTAKKIQAHVYKYYNKYVLYY